LTFKTPLELVGQWDRTVQWGENGFEGLDISGLNTEWQGIIDHVGCGHKRVQIALGMGDAIPLYKETALQYVHEVACHLEEVLGLPVDAYKPPVPPWS
jgi:hypothetical protein